MRKIVGLNMKAATMCTTLALAFPGVDVATAAASDDSALTEITVTAERREERLMDVPMTVQALSQANMDQQGIRNIDDLTRLAPGVTFLRNGVGSSSNYNDETSDIAIRGIDSNAGAATTGIYIDDTPISFIHGTIGVTPYPQIFDLDRVEVLEGPQGTLFGSGSMGGAIRFITPVASLTDYSGYARAEFGQIDHGGQNYEEGAAFGGPIIPGILGFRVSASYRRDGGWVDRADYNRPPSVVSPDGATLYATTPTVTSLTENNANWRDTQTFRAALRWQPVENLIVDPSVYVQTLHLNDTGAYWVDLSDADRSNYRNGNAQRSPSTDPWALGTVKVTWSAPWADLISNTSYFRRNQHSTSDYSQWVSTLFRVDQYPAPGEIDTATFHDRQTNVSQEFRLTSTDRDAALQWTGGIFYLHAYESIPADIYSAFLANDTPNNQTYHSPISDTVTKQLAIFGETTLKLPADFSLTTGVRFSKLDNVSSSENVTYGFLNNGDPTTTTGSVTASHSESNSKPVTPRAVVKYRPTDDQLYYASASKGFRPGASNVPFSPQTVKDCGLQVPTNVAPDSVWQYEVGSKNTLFDRHLQLSTSLYYFKWKGTQQTIYLSNCGFSFQDNLGDAVGKGGSLSLSWQATESLNFGLTAAYTDTVYQSIVTVPNSSTSVRDGDHLPASPWNVVANGVYIWNAFEKKPYIRLDYQFATAQRSLTPYLDPQNGANSDPTLPGLPEIRILSARAGIRFAGVDVSLFAQNLSNFHSINYASRDVAADYDTNYMARGFTPRTIGVTATYRY